MSTKHNPHESCGKRVPLTEEQIAANRAKYSERPPTCPYCGHDCGFTCKPLPDCRYCGERCWNACRGATLHNELALRYPISGLKYIPTWRVPRNENA